MNTQLLSEIYITDSVSEINVEQSAIRDLLLNESPESIYGFIKQNESALRQVSAANIPQFGDINLVPKVIEIVKNSNEIEHFCDIGAFHMSPQAKYDARRKYGENHYKLTMQLGLTRDVKTGFSLTPVGEMYNDEPLANKEIITKKLILRIPMIQQLLLLAENGFVNLTEYLSRYLAPSTVKRRRSNAKVLIRQLSSISETELQHLINNIFWN